MEGLYARETDIVFARMMGRINTAIVTFEGLSVPRFICHDGGEYRCYTHRPKQQVCGACLEVGHWVDVCPHPERSRCRTCGKPNLSDQQHACKPFCIHCTGDHPSTDSKCPARIRSPPPTSIDPTTRRDHSKPAHHDRWKQIQDPPTQPTTIHRDNLGLYHGRPPTRHRQKQRRRPRIKRTTPTRGKGPAHGLPPQTEEKSFRKAHLVTAMTHIQHSDGKGNLAQAAIPDPPDCHSRSRLGFRRPRYPQTCTRKGGRPGSKLLLGPTAPTRMHGTQTPHDTEKGPGQRS
ncbi:hypothetical protein HPB47_001179 [Ixodes persulcatus]|uniref:Uncharacterized protein n=1 Tax=Ixodes persulcatus TaxID=34615 RepID=A0AC60PPR5_IXOPE|nr:hypothetical protein HPB47_001179 [Ixodes persulcatus]